MTMTKSLITGASTGIGSVYAERLASKGHDLILVARSENKLNEVASLIQQRHKVKIEILVADLTQKSDVERLAERLNTDTTIDMLVNNAGVAATSPFNESSLDAMLNMIELNVTALTHLSMAAAKAFAARHNGTIINIASIVALNPDILNPVYVASKSYVLSLTQALHNELKEQGVRLQAVLPGATATPLWEKAGMPVDNFPTEWVMQPEDMVDAALKGLELGELVTIPSLPEYTDWQALENARINLLPNLSRQQPATRYVA